MISHNLTMISRARENSEVPRYVSASSWSPATMDGPKATAGLEWTCPKIGISQYNTYIYIHTIWVNYNDLTTTSLEIMVNKGNHPHMALIQVSEIL